MGKKFDVGLRPGLFRSVREFESDVASVGGYVGGHGENGYVGGHGEKSG